MSYDKVQRRRLSLMTATKSIGGGGGGAQLPRCPLLPLAGLASRPNLSLTLPMLGQLSYKHKYF